MKTIYKSFIREINTLGWEAEFLTDHVEFFYQGYRFRVVLEDEEDDLLRISANILSTDKSVREWIAILFECEGTWESPTYVYDVREEGDTFHIDVAISALFLFSQDIHNTALYFQDYVMREIMKKIEMIYECFRENYDKNFNVQLAEKGDLSLIGLRHGPSPSEKGTIFSIFLHTSAAQCVVYSLAGEKR